jgi:hypothetical protein
MPILYPRFPKLTLKVFPSNNCFKVVITQGTLLLENILKLKRKGTSSRD